MSIIHGGDIDQIIDTVVDAIVHSPDISMSSVDGTIYIPRIVGFNAELGKVMVKHVTVRNNKIEPKERARNNKALFLLKYGQNII